MNKKIILVHKIIILVSFVLCIALVVCGSFPRVAVADDFEIDDAALDEAGTSGAGYSMPANTLTVKVGYFGGPYYEKTIFGVSGGKGGYITLEDGSYVSDAYYISRTYSYIDNGGSVVVADAYGIDLEDLLDLAGIDIGSIQFMHFPTTDEHIYSLSKKELAGSDRYYYPVMEDYEYEDDIWDHEDEIEGEREAVRPMLALADNWDGSEMENKALRLMFGQEKCTQALAFESAKYIHSFIVQLGGTPTVDYTISWDKVGSRYQVTVNLTTTDSNGHTSVMDSTIRSQIAAGLTITSTNRNALDIPEDPVLNADGSITYYIGAGDGTTELNIGSENYSGNLSGDSMVTAEVVDGIAEFFNEYGQKVEIDGEDEHIAEKEKSGKEPSEGEGESSENEGSDADKQDGEEPSKESTDPESAGRDSEKAPEEESQSEDEISEQDETEEPTISSDEKTAIADKTDSNKTVQSLTEIGETINIDNDSENTETDGVVNENALTDGDTPDPKNAEVINSIRVQKLTIDTDQGAVQNWRDTDMADDATELGREKQDSTLPYSGAAASGIMGLGALLHLIWYTKERRN